MNPSTAMVTPQASMESRTLLQKILPRDPVDEILKSGSDDHIRTLLRNLCESSHDIKEKAQNFHKTILESTPPQPVDLAHGKIPTLTNHNFRKRKIRCATMNTCDNCKGRSTLYRDPISACLCRLGKPSSGLFSRKNTRRWSQSLSDTNGADAPISLTRLPDEDANGWFGLQGWQAIDLSTTIKADERNYEDQGGTKRICLPSLNQVMLESTNYSLKLPPILSLNLKGTRQAVQEIPQLEVNITAPDTIELDHRGGEEAGLAGIYSSKGPPGNQGIFGILYLS